VFDWGKAYWGKKGRWTVFGKRFGSEKWEAPEEEEGLGRIVAPLSCLRIDKSGEKVDLPADSCILSEEN